jgi:hypothetical protein
MTYPFARSSGQVDRFPYLYAYFFVIYEIIHFNIFVIMKFSVFFIILEKNKFGVIICQNIDHAIKDGCP